MTYEEWITTSKTWTCPKTGIWEIICVGGGAGGGLKPNASGNTFSQNTGGTTSFGSYLSASGGSKSNESGGFTGDVGGTGGYTGFNYGGIGEVRYTSTANDVSPATGNGGYIMEPGLGYGAGGGASGSSNSSGGGTAYSGNAGEIKSMTLDLSANQSITCTIGTGGAAGDAGTSKIIFATAGKAGCIHIRFIQ